MPLLSGEHLGHYPGVRRSRRVCAVSTSHRRGQELLRVRKLCRVKKGNRAAPTVIDHFSHPRILMQSGEGGIYVCTPGRVGNTTEGTATPGSQRNSISLGRQAESP
jgi:hypothetical protein